MRKYFLVGAAALLLSIQGIAPAVATFGPKNLVASNSIYTDKKHQGVVSELVLRLVTRSNALDPLDIDLLRPASQKAAKAFLRYLHRSGKKKDLRLFLNPLAVTLKKYDVDYQTAEPGPDGVSTRALAMSTLYDGLFAASQEARVGIDEFQMALLAALTEFEKQIGVPELTGEISTEVRELVNLLKLNTYHQLKLRSFFLQMGTALSTLNILTNQDFTTRWDQLLSIRDVMLEKTLMDIEALVLEVVVLQDVEHLIQQQFNEEAKSDIFAVRVALDFYYGGDYVSIEELIARMNSVGGVMADLTIEQFIQGGIFPKYQSSYGEEVSISFSKLAALDLVQPQMDLSYRPLYPLVDQLLEAGGEVPTQGDMSMFADPYLAMIEFLYDMDLCELIASQEWRLAGELYPMQILPVAERFKLRQGDFIRRARVSNRLQGLGDEHRDALRNLLIMPWP